MTPFSPDKIWWSMHWTTWRQGDTWTGEVVDCTAIQLSGGYRGFEYGRRVVTQYFLLTPMYAGVQKSYCR